MDRAAHPSEFDRQGAHTLWTAGLSVGLGFLLSVVLARGLGPAGKGMLDVASATIGLFTLVLGCSLNTAITQDVARHGAVSRALPAQLALWSFAALAVTAACLGVQPKLAAQLGLLPTGEDAFWIWFVTVSAGFGIWAAGLRGILIGRHAVILANRIDLTVKASLLAAYASLTVVSAASPKPFALAGMGAALGLALLLLWATPGGTGTAPGTWPRLLAMTLPVHGTNVLHFVTQRADVFFIQAFHGAREVGLYALAVSLAQSVLLISTALAMPLLPQVAAAGSAEQAAAATARACRMFIALALVAALVLAAAAAWLVPWVFGRAFGGTVPSLLLLLPGILGFGLTNILISYFVGIGRSRVNLAISVATLLVTLAGNASLTWQLGGIGAAITSTLAYSLAGGLSLWQFMRTASLPLPQALIPHGADWMAAWSLVRRLRL